MVTSHCCLWACSKHVVGVSCSSHDGCRTCPLVVSAPLVTEGGFLLKGSTGAVSKCQALELPCWALSQFES